MNLPPNHRRLRIVALLSWAFGAWWMLQPVLLAVGLRTPLLGLAGIVLAAFCFAVGVSFWLLGTDRHAGVALDRKGLELKLGHSASFVAWENIADLGVSTVHQSLFTLGSRRQLGIRLHSPEQYLQSYETRLPASPGPLARAVRLVERVAHGLAHEPDLAAIADLRRRTGYDILIPEALLGRPADTIVALIEAYRVGELPA